MKKIKKAVFPVAGFGTRFLPATKASPKELLPVLEKPLIQYAVEEALEAGIDTLIFITGRNKRAIEDHFDRNFELEQFIKEKGTDIDMASLNMVPDDIECIFIRQREQLGLGHAVLCANKVVGEDPFALILADDFLTMKTVNTTKELIKKYEKENKSVIATVPVEDNELDKYGIVGLSDDATRVLSIIEKPCKSNAPSNLASIGRYVIKPDVFDCLKNIKAGVNNEIQLADALNQMAKRNEVTSLPIVERRFDCGTIHGYVEAINFMYALR